MDVELWKSFLIKQPLGLFYMRYQGILHFIDWIHRKMIFLPGQEKVFLVCLAVKLSFQFQSNFRSCNVYIRIFHFIPRRSPIPRSRLLFETKPDKCFPSACLLWYHFWIIGREWDEFYRSLKGKQSKAIFVVKQLMHDTFNPAPVSP